MEWKDKCIRADRSFVLIEARGGLEELWPVPIHTINVWRAIGKELKQMGGRR